VHIYSTKCAVAVLRIRQKALHIRERTQNIRKLARLAKEPYLSEKKPRNIHKVAWIIRKRVLHIHKRA